MSKLRLTALAALGILGLLSMRGFAEPYSHSGKQVNSLSEVSILGRITSDGDDPTVTLYIWENQGLLIRMHSIWSTGEGGRSWKLMGQVSQHRGPSSFEAVWPRNKTDIFALAGGSVFESTNQGRDWKRKGAIPGSIGSFRAMAGDDEEKWLVSAGQRSVPTSQKNLSSLPKYANDVASTSQAPRMFIPAISIAEDDGQIWQSAPLPKEIGALDRVVVSGSFAIAIGPYTVLTTTNKGRSWLAPKEIGVGDEEEAYPLSAAIFGKRLWVSLKNGTLLTGDISKQELAVVSKSAVPLEDLRFTDSCRGFALRENNLATTADGGITWREVTHSKDVLAMSVSRSGIFAATHDQVLRINPQHGQPGTACVN